MDKKLWWKKPLRAIQTNLQVIDTPLMKPAKIASEVKEMEANVLVINVGGIYAWYHSNIKYHHINEYLPKDFDLLEDIIKECHQRNIKVFARFDSSKTDDYVYQEKPEWFVREADMSPRAYGVNRPGNWSLLYTTCINSGYRSEEVAIPVLEEVIDRYDIDGIFFNAPHYEYCCCDACKMKYEKKYGKPLPIVHTKVDKTTTFASIAQVEGLEPGFAGLCVHDNLGKIYGAVKKKVPDLPLVLYYGMHNENLNDRYATADMICTEAQNVLSRGSSGIPNFTLPMLTMKMGRTAGISPIPFGIIHSCPGMDWRHTGMPEAEYLYWLSQIPASGGSIWHSITGFNDTITDKRIIKCIAMINKMTSKVEELMDGAISISDTVLLWNSKQSSEGWAEALANTQIQFDLLDTYQVSGESLKPYKAVIVPNDYPFSPKIVSILQEFTADGGGLLIESNDPEQLKKFASYAGYTDNVYCSEYLTASYWQYEEEGDVIRQGFEETPILPHRGVTAYIHPLKETKVLGTLIPPFAPLDAVGAPPERANILTKSTNIPLCTVKAHEKGKVMIIPFVLSKLVTEYKLAEHTKLAANMIHYLLGNNERFHMEGIAGIIANAYENNDHIFVHFNNGIGQRPLKINIPFYGMTFEVKVPNGHKVKAVEAKLSDTVVTWKVQNDILNVQMEKLDFWDMIDITLI